MKKKQSNPKPPLATPPNPPPPPLVENLIKIETAEGRLALSKAAADIAAREGELFLWLRQYPELRDKLLEALRTEHFLVTVHCQLVKPGSSNDLQHYFFQCGYPPGDIVSSLKHIATVHAAKTNPAADVSGAKGWV